MKQYIRIGPWSTTNIADNPTQIADSELAYTENVVIDGKGGLRPRPGFQWVSRPGDMVAANVPITILGSFYGEIYVSVQTGGGIVVHRYNIDAGTWASGFSIGAGTSFTCGAAFAYNGEVYFVASANGALTKGGHRFNPTTFSTSVTATAEVVKGLTFTFIPNGSLTSDLTTTLTIFGNETGGSVTIPVTVTYVAPV